jgi:iron-sulfur cluster repair protein YtfE (RIC family)
MSSESVNIFFPAAVRERVLEQHSTLRELLEQALDVTTRVFQTDRPARDELARLIHEVRVRFRAHLAFEERTLVPVLAHVDLWGPERVLALHEEHARQRSELDTLVEGLEEEWDLERLAVTLRSLATDLLVDMEEEEHGCVSADLLRDELMIVGTMRE